MCGFVGLCVRTFVGLWILISRKMWAKSLSFMAASLQREENKSDFLDSLLSFVFDKHLLCAKHRAKDKVHLELSYCDEANSILPFYTVHGVLTARILK